MSNFQERYSRENIVPQGQETNPEHRLHNEVLADKHVGCVCKTPNPLRGTRRLRAKAAEYKLNSNMNDEEIIVPAAAQVGAVSQTDPFEMFWSIWASQGINCEQIWGDRGLQRICFKVRREQERLEKQLAAKQRFEAEVQRREQLWAAKAAAKAGNPVQEIVLRKNKEGYTYTLSSYIPKDKTDAYKLGLKNIGGKWYLPSDKPYRPDGPGPQQDIITVTYNGVKYTGPRYRTANNKTCVIIGGDMIVCDNSVAFPKNCKIVNNAKLCQSVIDGKWYPTP